MNEKKPIDTCRTAPTTGSNPGFTLVELLVVVAIIAVLAGLIFAVMPGIHRSSQAASTRNTLIMLQSAIDRYQNDYRRYPGPVSDAAVATGSGLPTGLSTLTMAENLTLGLLGGLRPTASGANAPMTYDPTRTGKGTINLSTLAPSPPKNYLPGDLQQKGYLSAAGQPFSDLGGRTASDSAVPEFIDQFEQPLPILYLRANVGMPGIMSDASTPGSGKLYQYDLRQVLPYTSSRIGLTDAATSHGLRSLGSSTSIPESYSTPAEALPLLRQPGPPKISPTSNATGTPRQKDRYILISAGADRIYGTDDDITNF